MQLFNLSKEVRALVEDRTTRLAQGSAIWTKILIGLIEVRGIRALGPGRNTLTWASLKALVTPLTQSTSNEPRNQKIASIALKLLAVTRRPLSIQELAWAVTLSAAQQGVTTVAALAKLVDH